MNPTINTIASQKNAFDVLRRFAPKKIEGEQCDLCSLRIGEQHQHLLELRNRRIMCACEACAVLFSNHGTAKYKRIPRDAKILRDFQLTDIEWESLAIPIGLAFFFHQSNSVEAAPGIAIADDRATEAKTVKAFYPSPAGATESLLDLSAWKEIESTNPSVLDMQPDVEALLVNRIGKTRDYYLAPIDECYKLVGLIRTNWRGLSGGREVWLKIEEFFRALRKEPARL